VAGLLYLVHRLPYPPNKGDKVRSYHLLKHLAARHRVHLGTFVDDPDDERHVDTVRGLCAGLHVARLDPRVARIRSLAGLVSGEALTVSYYRDARLREWVRDTVRREGIRDAVVFSSAMSQYVDGIEGLRVILDCVDVDSAKWTQYAGARRWPLSALYAREGRRLLDYEARAVQRSAHTFFVTEAETQLFARLAPGCAGRISAAGNGVDAEYFSPRHPLDSPFDPDELPVVFTGAMDYWPNVDAVQWFVADVLPRLRAAWPRMRFYIVGMRPAPAVTALASDSVVVTGTVPDVRPYLAHAAVVAAPLRLARGIQNKILEAMAMGRPVVASAASAEGIDAEPGRDLLAATDASDFAERVDALLRDRSAATAMGQAARERVLARYSWDAQLGRFDEFIDGPSDAPRARRSDEGGDKSRVSHAAA
jgi:sugar transferase (PEP-CTERM/EpsH1 system associated)